MDKEEVFFTWKELKKAINKKVKDDDNINLIVVQKEDIPFKLKFNKDSNGFWSIY